MCGAMDVYSMKYGVWGVNHLRTLQILRYATTINYYIVNKLDINEGNEAN